MPGSKDLIDFDYLSDQPDIEVETWGNSELALSEGWQAGAAAAAAPEASVVVLDGNHGHDDTGQQQLAGTTGAVGFQDSCTSSDVLVPEQQAGVLGEAGRNTSGSEIREYLDSQQTFSFDFQSRETSIPAGAEEAMAA